MGKRSLPVSCGHRQAGRRRWTERLGEGSEVPARVGITEREDGRWLVSFLSFNLGIYDTSQRDFEPFEQLRESSLGESTN